MRALQRLGAFSDPDTELMPLYVAVTRQRLDWLKALLTLGASLQDSVAPGKTVLRLLLTDTCMSPRDLAALFKTCIGCRSERIITFPDVACLLDAHCSESYDSHRYRLRERKEVRRCILPGPDRDPNTTTEENARFISYENLDDIRTLWAYIAKANRVQSQPLKAPDGTDDSDNDNNTTNNHNKKLPNLLLFAALRSNWSAVRFLLDIRFPPNGTSTGTGGPLFKDTHLRNMPPITPLDVVQWTSYVPESDAPRDLRASNRQIASLLLENGGRHSVAFGSAYYLLVRPVGDRLGRAWAWITRDKQEVMGVLVLLLLSGLMWWFLGYIYVGIRNAVSGHAYGVVQAVVDTFVVSCIVVWHLCFVCWDLARESWMRTLFQCVYGGSFRAARRMVYARWRGSALGWLRSSSSADALSREEGALLGGEDPDRFQREYDEIILSP